jgi:hypothetical protein
MVLVAVVEAVALVAIVVAFAGILARSQRAHARREDLLINQLLHAAGKTWQPAPAETAGAGGRREPEPALVRFTPSPEQLPVD